MPLLRVSSKQQIVQESIESRMGSTTFVKGIKELTDSGIDHVPKKYIRPVDERPCLSEVSYTDQVPFISLDGLLDGRRGEILQEIVRAAENWGFFQVINHGVPQYVIDNMFAAVHSFFEQPAEQRMAYSSTYTDRTTVAYITSFNQSKEKFLNWKDTLRFRYSSRLEGFNVLPVICQEAAFEYCRAMKDFGKRLYAAISESLGLPSKFLYKCMGKFENINMSMHYYPPCPNPNLTFGMSGNTDPNVITILLQDEVGGLQVLKDSKWIAVKPVVNSFVINIGDQLQILSNGKFKSVQHRVVTNSENPRVAIPTFFNPSEDISVGPLPQFIDHDDDRPPLYTSTLYKDYASHFYNNGLNTKSSLDFAACSTKVLDELKLNGD